MYIHKQRNRHLQWSDSFLVQIVVSNTTQTKVKSDVWEHYGKTRMKKFTTCFLITMLPYNVCWFSYLHFLISSDLLFYRIVSTIWIFLQFFIETHAAFYSNYMLVILCNAPSSFEVAQFNFPVFFQQFCVTCIIFVKSFFERLFGTQK